MLWRLMKRKMGQKAWQETDGAAHAGGLGRRVTRRRISRLASQSQEEAAAQTETVQTAPEWRHFEMEAAAGAAQSAPAWRQYAGNGTFTNTRLAATYDPNSCALSPQSNSSSQRVNTSMISDAAIAAANMDVERAEQELKSLSEALDRMKVRPLEKYHVNRC